jgi:hypothetical protein
MNCTQVEDLMPLYAGRDLNDGRAQSITVHLQTCARCAAAASEHRETRQLLQEFAPPVFSDETYAEIRQSVSRKIQAQSNASPLSVLVADWFRPRMVWALATALLIAVSAIGIYLIGNGWSAQKQNTASAPKIGSGQIQAGTRGSDKPATSSSHNAESRGQRYGNTGPYQRKLDRKAAPERVNSVVMNSPDPLPAKTETRSQIDVPTEADVSARDAKTTLRVEIQTRNPNIRIIWFAQRDAKPVSANSKGI